MKRSNLKSFILGVLAASLVFSVLVPAMASTLKTAELYYNDIKIRLNGDTVVPKDAAGNAVDPFIIDGTTYLPIRAIASALGLNVGWDAANQTVILGNDPEYKQPAAWLGELDTFTGTASESKVTNQQYDNYSTANNGDTFDRLWFYNYSRTAAVSNNSVSYLLKGQYTRLTGTFYVSSYSKNTKSVRRLLVYSDDDNLIYTSPELTSGVEPVDFDIDVSNCYKLTIVCQVKSGDNWSNNGLVETFRDSESYYFYVANAALWTD